MRRALSRDLSYFWRMNLAVVAGAAVATAVLAGALVVGDSVRGSLRQLTAERLGGIDHALAGQRFFPADAAERLENAPGFAERFADAAPVILLRGSARHAETRRRASDVGLQGVDDRFFALFGADDPFTANEDGSGNGGPVIFPPAAINQRLADALGAAVGDAILVSLQRFTEVPDGSLLAYDDTASVVETVRLSVVRILPDRDLGAFGLEKTQGTAPNVFVPLADLQNALDQDDKVNSIVVEAKAEPSEGSLDEATALDDLLRQVLEPEELGLLVSTKPDDGFFTIESDEYVLKDSLVRAIEVEAEALGGRTLPILTYLANRISKLGPGGPGGPEDEVEVEASVPYSTATALPFPLPSPETFGGLAPASDLEADSILLDAWTAEELAAAPGDRVRLDFFTVGAREELREEHHDFTVAGVVAMAGLAVDPTLSQEYPGIAGSASMSDWDPPFPVDLGQIRTSDEEYWDDYRGAPKVFLPLATGRELWSNRWGQTTAVRIAPGAGQSEDGGEDLDAFRDRFLDELKADRPMASFGLVFQPVKALGLRASSGATDFGGLFLGLSMFVIASAALLVALLFGLAVERRAGEIGLLLATGFRPKQVRRRLLAEGAVLGAIGGVIGLFGAVGYAAAMMAGLRTWWLPAVGTSRLELFVNPATLGLGFAIAFAIVLLTIWLTVRRVGQTPTPQLLKRVVASGDPGRAGRRSTWTAAIALTIAFGTLLVAIVTGETQNPTFFYIIGPTLLVGLLALFAVWIDRPQTGALADPGPGALARMAITSSRRNRGRSLLATSLVAFASFLIVTVAANQEEFSAESLGLDSGTGGYELVVEADVPLQQDLADPDGRFELGLPDDAESLLEGATIESFRLVPGDDTSCLNLYQPGQPRLLGVPRSQVERGGFVFAGTLDAEDAGLPEDPENPWTLLDLEFSEEENVIPAIGDANSTQWILKLPIGDEISMENERGEEVRIRLVATLQTSIFQSELLISEERLLEHWPSRGGFPYFLVDAPEGEEIAASISEAFEAGLEGYGVDAEGTAEKLERFHAVQNTYLETFRALGGLGLLLGTVGLAIVLLRNVLERRSELAALQAFGFRKATLTKLVVWENAALLLVGLSIGTIAALTTVGPRVLRHAAAVPWTPLVTTLGAILVVGLLACWLSARSALRADLIPALKAEG